MALGHIARQRAILLLMCTWPMMVKSSEKTSEWAVMMKETHKSIPCNTRSQLIGPQQQASIVMHHGVRQEPLLL